MRTRPLRNVPSRLATLGMALGAGILIAGCVWGGAPGAPSAEETSPTLQATLAPTVAPSSTVASTTTPLPTMVPASPERPAAEVTVQCGPGAPVLSASRTRAWSDGVHFVVRGTVGWELSGESPAGMDGRLLDSSAGSLALLIPPGSAEITCVDPSAPGDRATTPLLIEDPDRLYYSTEPGPTAGGCTTGSASYGEDPRGIPGDPVAIARASHSFLRPGDVVERGGYPVEKGRVRIVRAGVVLGHVTYSPDGHGGWLFESETLCGNLR